ncbi:MAG: hypothetical protein H6678_05605 [Candidatus Delongbacteria bacterium]|nr:hypothetical protein [Candidatus Delongbacteria bacterium]
MLNRIIRILHWILVFLWILSAVLTLSAFLPSVESYLSNVISNFNVSFAEFLTLFVVTSTALIAVLTLQDRLDYNKHEKIFRDSMFYFQQAKDGLQEALELLRDGNNDRVLWIRAARAIKSAQTLAEHITTASLRTAYKQVEHRTRNELYLALTILNDETGRREPLPPQFFYGTRDWRTPCSLDELAVATSGIGSAYSPDINSLPKQPVLDLLDQRSIMTIMDFTEYPADFEDPLHSSFDGIPDWEHNWEYTIGFKGGAMRYFAHRKQFYAMREKLRPTGSNSPE